MNKESLPPKREALSSLPPFRQILADKAQKEYRWLVPAVSFLESESTFDRSNAHWTDTSVVVFESGSFPHSTSATILKLQPVAGYQFSGFLYLVKDGNLKASGTSLAMEKDPTQTDGFVAHLPEMNAGERLILVAKIHSRIKVDLAKDNLTTVVTTSLEKQ